MFATKCPAGKCELKINIEKKHIFVIEQQKKSNCMPNKNV